jgi:hypothetical protein
MAPFLGQAILRLDQAASIQPAAFYDNLNLANFKMQSIEKWKAMHAGYENILAEDTGDFDEEFNKTLQMKSVINANPAFHTPGTALTSDQVTLARKYVENVNDLEDIVSYHADDFVILAPVVPPAAAEPAIPASVWTLGTIALAGMVGYVAYKAWIE